jgi:UDP-2,3-diacylglucosamine pyrophosphatase LpxH
VAIPESLLVLSDVHLGSDLNDRGPRVPRSVAIDRDLVALLAHYRAASPDGKRWRLVLAGDFIDFVGMAVEPRDGDRLETSPTALDRDVGLGGAEDHVRIKLGRVAERHADVFAELGRFVAAGHTLTIVLGNHDLELHWESVKRDFCAALERAARASDLSERIEFCAWFFRRDRLVYVEHGHQYDPFCALPYVLAPLSPLDPNRVAASVSDTLLRHIVRRTPGMREYGHETRGLTSYISKGLFLGVRGAWALVRRFFATVFQLRRSARAYASPSGAALAREQDRRLRELSASEAIPEKTLRAVLALQVRPIGVFSSVLLDRLAALVVVLGLLAGVFVFRHGLGDLAAPLAAAIVFGGAALHVVFSRARPAVDSSTVLAERAGHLARLFDSSFVVMGHTHVPMTAPLPDADAASYVNLGSWAEEEPDPAVAAAGAEDPPKAGRHPEGAVSGYRAARTHLVVHDHGDVHEARFCEWRPNEGPRELGVLVRHAAGAASSALAPASASGPAGRPSLAPAAG